MKILFTADLHIKLGQKNVPIDWQKNRFKLLFNQLNSIITSNSIELLILGGDIFDRLPTMEELELYFDMINTINHTNILIYSGNHEAVKKNTTFLSNLKLVTKALNNNAEILDEFYTLENMDFIPYNQLKSYHPADIDFQGDILFTHVRGEIPPHVQPEVNLSLFDRWKIVFAGDLHSHSNCQRNIVYPGSPVTTSFHRSEVDTGVIIINSETLEWEWVKLTVPQLLRKTVSSTKDMIKTDYHHTIYEVEGDLAELSKVKNSDLLDKKIVQKESAASLALHKKMTLDEELRLYLQDILKLEDTKIDTVVKEFNDISKTIEFE